jgi:hypothetical protein
VADLEGACGVSEFENAGLKSEIYNKKIKIKLSYK